MDEECVDSSEPIFELASECEQLFSQQVLRLRHEADTNATKAVGEFQQRFSAWAAFLGIFAVPEMCLDRKLQHHVEMQDLVLRLLDVMKRNLTYLFEAPIASSGEDIELTDSDPPSPSRSHLRISVESLRGVEGAIERLHHLGGTIQLSSEASQAVRISKFASGFDSSSFEQFASLAMSSLYPDANPSLLEHLARAMTDMYHKFHYRRSRRARLQARPSVALSPINEESASCNQPTSWRADPAPVPASPPTTDFHRQAPRPIVRSHLGARSHQSRDSKPTSLDSQEFKRRFSQHQDGSVKSKTRSILAKQMAYPPQSEDSLVCDWCFSPLSADESKGENWRKHLNEDFKPFVCISENCSEPLNRFATSRAWFSHMLETHGQHWHRQVHLPAWYICPLCNSQGTTYSRASDLSEHLMKLHADVFTEQQSQIIVHQSRLRAPRSQDICPLCCLSMADGQEFDEGDQFLKKAFPTLSVQDNQAGESHKRIKTEAGAKQPNDHSDNNINSTGRTTPDAQALSSQKRPPLHVEAIAKHVASHLQGIMLLTLRMMVIEVAPEVSTDNKSLSGGTDNGVSRFGSTRQLSQREVQDTESTDKSWIQDDGNMDIDDPFLEEFIPDCEHDVDWQDVILNDEPSPEADPFLQQVADSGAFQIKNWVLSSDNAAVHTHQQQRHHPQRGVIISLPFRRDPFFTGRKPLLHNLIQRCSAPPSRIALVGLGGIGKTHLAIELAHRIVLSGDASIFWIRADTQSSIEEGFACISSTPQDSQMRFMLLQQQRKKRLNIRDQDDMMPRDGHQGAPGPDRQGFTYMDNTDTPSTFAYAFDWLSDDSNGRWLVILDGVNENNMSFLHNQLNLLRSQNGTILVTTRHKKVAHLIAGNKSNVIEMERMTVFDAVHLLGQKLGRSENNSWRGPRSTSDLVKSLGLSPLTICRAAAYIQSMPAPGDVSREDSMSSIDEDCANKEDGNDEDEVEATYIDHDAIYPGVYPAAPGRPTFDETTWYFDGEDLQANQEEGGGKQKRARYIMAHKFRQLLNSEQEKIKLLEFEPPSPDGGVKAMESILTIWRTSFNAVQSERPSAVELLSLMSFFDRRGIPKWLLELCKQDNLGFYQRASSNNEITSDIETLLDHCLISSNGTKDIFSMQGLMQLAVQSCLDRFERHTTEHVFLRGLKDSFPRDFYSNWAICEELFAHVQVAANRQPSTKYQLRDWTTLLYRAARFTRAQGNYEVAIQMANQAENAASYFGRSQEWPALSSLTALVLMDQGLYDKADILLTDLTDECKDGAHRMTSMHNLACLHKLKGRWNEAEAILAEVTKDRRTKLGENHPRTLSSMANLASLRRAQGRYQEAHSLLLQVFVSYTGHLGPDHPQTLASMNDLGSIYRLLGKLDEAERYQKQAHESRKMIFGADHPDTLASMNGLASTYRLQGRLDEAEALQEHTLEARKRILGPNHPSTLASMNNLALILNDQGKHGVASKLQSQVLDACKEKLGPEHPHTLTSMNNLALIWRNQDRKSLTRWTMQNCVQARRRVLGPEHPYTVSSARIAYSWTPEKEKMGVS